MKVESEAIMAGKGEIAWDVATEIAINTPAIREYCEAAAGPSDDEVRELAIKAIEGGDTSIMCDDDDMPLIERVNWALTSAAAHLICKEAESLKEADEAEEFDRALRDRAVREAAVEAVFAALRDRVEVVADGYGGFGSVYLRYKVGGQIPVEIRISDHPQVRGGGWSSMTGERHGESDVSFVIRDESDIPTRDEIREAVLAAVSSLL